MKVIMVVAFVAFLAVAQGATGCNNRCDDNASSCQTKTEAAACVAGYGLSSNNKCVKCGDAKTVPGTGTKSVGVDAGAGQWWEPWNAGKCTTCVTNCKTCENSNTCKVCASGYWPTATTSKTCTACGANCADCASATTCKTCKAYYFVKAGKCESCGAKCKACTDEKTCTAGQCDKDYQKAADGNCVLCKTGDGVFFTVTKAGLCSTVANCKTAKTKDTCTTCKAGYTTDAKEVCVACTPASGSCKTCNNADLKKCTECNGKESLSTDGICSLCGDTARKTDGAAGLGKWYTVAKAGACADCQANCKTCAEAKKCADNGCNEGFATDANTNNAGVCKACSVASCATCKTATAGTKCDKCKAGFIIDNTNAKCVACPENCKTCTYDVASKTSQCAVCKDGFALGNNKGCVACTYDGGNNVKDKDGKAPKPNTMISTFVPDNEPVCTNTCGVNCAAGSCKKQADGTYRCEKCATGTWPYDKDGKTAKATQVTDPGVGGSCKDCDANGTGCEKCKSAGKCQTCKGGTKSTTTVKFSTGYYSSTDKCEKCKGTGNCVTCDATGACNACDTGYSLDGKKNCVKCGTLTLNTDGAAGVNGEYFTAADGSCSTVANCATAKGKDTCTTCKAGFTTDAGNKCVACTPASGSCKTCNNADLKKCTSCKEKESLSTDGICSLCGDTARNTDGAAGLGKWYTVAKAGACATCQANCKTCASATTCADNGCNSGYITDALTANKGVCTKCSVGNCGACVQATATTLCTSCIGKFAQSADKKSCSQQCDVHATSCTDANTAAKCDNKNKYWLAGGRCKYCDVSKAGATAKGSKDTKFFDAATGGCFCCDPNASGCADKSTPAGCKTGYTLSGGRCQPNCATGNVDTGTGKGKCYTCQAQALKNADIPTGFYNNGGNPTKGSCSNEWQAAACNKNYYVQGSMIGSCCPIGGNAASGVFQSVATVAGLVASAAALLH